jgi:hypothetical protein
LRVIAGFVDDLVTVAEDGHAVIIFLGQFPDERAVAGFGEIGDFEFHAGEFQNPPLHEAERTPRELDEFNHAKVLRQSRRIDKRNSFSLAKNFALAMLDA